MALDAETIKRLNAAHASLMQGFKTDGIQKTCETFLPADIVKREGIIKAVEALEKILKNDNDVL